MEKSPSHRLGSGPTDAEEVKEHHFFYGLDWDKLLRKGYTPPYNPNLVCVCGRLVNLSLHGWSLQAAYLCTLCENVMVYVQTGRICILYFHMLGHDDR